MSAITAEYKKQTNYKFNNFQLKRWLYGDKNRRRKLLDKLKDDLRKLGLSKRATRAGLIQLAIKPCVILKRLSVSCRGKKPLQSSHNIKQSFIPFHNEKLQSKHQDDDEKMGREDNSQDIAQQSDTQILSSVIGTASISVTDADKTYQSRIKKCDLSRKELLDNTTQDLNKNAAEKSDIKAASSFSSLKNKSLKKQKFVYKSINKSSCSESKITFLKDKSTFTSVKEANISINQNCPYSRNESSDTTVSIRFKKHHSDSESSIEPSKDDNMFGREPKIGIKPKFSLVKAELIDTSREGLYESRSGNVSFESNVNSSNAIISKLKIKVSNFTDRNQDMSSLDKLEELVKHIDTSLYQTPTIKDVNQTKINVESKNLQTDSQSIETNFKTIMKRKRSKSLDRNTLPIKIQKENEVNMSQDAVVVDSNIETCDNEILSDDELDYTNPKNEESVIKSMIKERENYKLLKRIKERCKKENNKIKKIRTKLNECFRGNFDPDSTESEEEHEILLNYLKKNKQQSDLLDDSITEEEVEYIIKRDKLIHPILHNNGQKDIKSATKAKIKSDNLCDSIVSTEKYAIYDTITDKKIKDGASLDKHDTLANNSQENIEDTNFDNSCDVTACTEKFCDMYDATTEEVEDETSACKSSTCVNNLQKNIESTNSDISCDSEACTEKYYPIQDIATDKEIEDGTLICECDTSNDKSQENIKSAIPKTEIKSENSNNSSTSKENHYVTIEKDIKTVASICNCDTSINNSQENIDVQTKIKSVKSSDSFEYTKKYCAINSAVIKKVIKNKALTRMNDMSPNNSQKNIENTIPNKTKSNNSCNSTANTEKTVTIEKKIKASIHDMLSNNSQKNIERTILLEVISDKSCDFTTNIEKCAMNNITSDEKTGNRASICTPANNSQENIESAIPAEVNSDNSCDSTSNIEKYAMLNDEVSAHTHNILANNSLKNIENAIPVEVISDNSCNSIANMEKNVMHDTTTNRKTGNETSICKLGTFINNSQENMKSITSVEVESDNSCDSTANIEKYYPKRNSTIDEKVEDRALICKRDMLANNSSENIENVVSTKEQHMQNSASNVETKNISKNDARAEHIKNIPSMMKIDLNENMSIKNINLNQNVEKKADIYSEVKEVNMQAVLQNRQENQEMRNVKNVDSVQRRNMQKHATSNLSITSAYELTSCNVEKNDYDISQNVKNLLSTSNNIVKDEKTIDLPMMASKLEKSSLDKSNDSLSIQSSNELTPSHESSKSDYNDNHSLVSHSADDDNNSDIEVEIKIKPKLKSRISQKFSLKAPWSSVNMCIKNLHTLKDNPSFLNDLFQIDHRTSEKSKPSITNTSPKDDMSLDDNKKNITAETDEIICDSSLITKDNVNNSQQQNFQDNSILNEDRNVMDCNQKEKDRRTQSVIQKIGITTENNLGANELTSDLGKQLQKASTNDKKKTKEKQNSRNNITLEGSLVTSEEIRSVDEYNQGKEIECILSIEKKTEITAENSSESVKNTIYDTSNVAKQLPQTSSDTTHSKVRVRPIAELSCQCTKSTNLDTSTPRSVCSAFCQSASFQSVSSQLVSSQSVSQQPPPSYDTAPKHTYLSLNTSSSIESNTSNINKDLINLIQTTIKNVCTNIEHCRNFIRYKLLRLYAPEDYMQRLYMSMKQISEGLELLKVWLRMNDIENVIIYVNRHMPVNQPLTIIELIKYFDLVKSYLFYTQTSEQNNAKSKALQHPNGGSVSTASVPNVSMPNVNAQPFLRNAPFSETRMPNRSVFIQSSTIPRSVQAIPNINQQQLFGNSTNSTQVPNSKQSTLETSQQYMIHVSPTTHIRMPNVNQQQSSRNASHLIQGQYMSTDMLNIGIQQGFVNMNNVSSSNANMRSRETVNQGNTNISPTTSTMRQYVALQKNTISSTATASTTNAQQQKQMYFQTLQINSGTVCPPPMTNQNISLEARQTVHNVTLPESLMDTSCNLQVSQASSEKTQSLPQYTPNSNDAYYLLVSQSAHCNMQTHPVQNTLPDQNARQISQQKLPVNQENANMPPTTNVRQSYVASKNTISSTIATSQRLLLPKDTSTCPIDLSINDTLQNVQQNMWQIPQQKLSTNQGNTNIPPTTNTGQSQFASNITIGNTTTAKTQRLLPKNTTTRSVDLSIDDTLPNMQQNVRQIPQQKLPVNQGNTNTHPTNMGQLYVPLNNSINSTTTAKNQRLILPNTFVCPNDLTINDISQNVQQNVLNKETENKNHTQKKTQYMNPQQDERQETPNVCNMSQNISGTILKTSSQRSNVFQNMMSKIVPQKDNAGLIMQKSTLTRLQTNKGITNFNFNLAILTDIQKIVLRDQIKLYFTMLDEQKNSLNQQEFEQMHYERVMLFYLYWKLDDYIKDIMTVSQTAKKSVKKSSQDNISQNKSILQENTIQIFVDKSMKTQSNRDNENSSACNKNLEKQSLERSIDPNISKNSKSMAVKNNLEVSNKESFLMLQSTMTKTLLPKDTRLREQDNPLKKQSQKSSLVDIKEESESTKTSLSDHLKMLKKNSNIEVSVKNSETEVQDNAKIYESLKVSSSHDNQFPTLYCLLAESPLTSLPDTSTKKTEDLSNVNERSNNVKIKSVCKISNVVTINNSEKDDATSRAPCNTEKEVHNASNETLRENLQYGTRDNITKNIEILNSTKIQSNPLNTLSSLEPSSLHNMRQSISPIKKHEFIEISKPHEKQAKTTSELFLSTQQADSVNERSNDSTDETSENSGKLYIDESAEKQEQCDKISSSEEDNLSTRILQDSTKLSDTIRCDSTKVTLSLPKNPPEADLPEIYQDFESKAQDIEELNEEQTTLESEKIQLQGISLKLKDEWNMGEKMIQSIDNIKKYEGIKEENSEQLLLKAEKIEFQEMSLKFEIPEDTSSIEKSSLESICLKLPEDLEGEKMEMDTRKPPKDTEEKMEIDTHSDIKMTIEDSKQSILKADIEFQEMSSKFEDPKDTSNTEENTIDSIYLKLSEKEKTEIDTHSGIKAISDQFKHVYEQKYYGKWRTSARNSIQKDNSHDVKEAKIDFPNVDIVECISVKSDDDSNSIPNILNIRSISPSLFEKIENMDAFLQDDPKSLNENDGKSLDINDNLGIPDVDKPCLRCKRKSTVYCQDCLEAHYCSKRCSSLHWNAEHYKHCKGHNSIICID